MGRARAIRTGVTTAVVVAVLVYLFRYPQVHGASDVRVWAEAIYIGVAAMGLNLLTGYNGQVSIGHGAFFGLGAYTSAILVQDHGWPFLATLPVAALLAAAVGAAVGFPALRVKGFYLALITLGLAVLFPDLTKKFVDGTGGTNLVKVRRVNLAAPSWWPERASAPDQFAFYVALIVALVLLVVVILLVRGRFGRALVAVRDHEAAASTVGVNLARIKVSAFALSALYAGVAGSLSVLVKELANADRISTFDLSIRFLVAVVLGGTATVVGPLLGGWLVVLIQEVTADFVKDPAFLGGFFRGKEVLSPAIFGVILILLMYVLPDGLVGGGRRAARFLGRRIARGRLRPATT